MDCSTPGLPVPHRLLEFAQVHVDCVSYAIDHLMLCCPLLLLPSIFPRIRFFSNELAAHIRWTNLDSIVKSRDIALPMNAYIVKALVVFMYRFMYRCESWTIKKAEQQRIDAFKLWCWRRLLRVP